MKTKGFKFLPEELKGKRTPQDLFDFYKNNWLDCDADPDFLEQAFELGMEGKDLPNDWYNMGLTDMDYIEDMNSIGQDIQKRGIKAVFAEIRADAKEDNDTDLLEDRDFNAMVEDLEENEDMVECKECFDLFPKADCEKSEVGYVCPVCRGLKVMHKESAFIDPYDHYVQEFPEVNDYDPEAVTDYGKEPNLGDVLSDLIKDEYEAIEGYEAADEIVQHAAIDGDAKDEILDTLEHIKEEEEEHIDELKEFCPECDPVAEPKVEPEKLEEAADDEEATDEEPEAEEIPEEEAEDSEENENEEILDLEAAYEAALEIATESGVGQVFGYAKKETEEFVAIEPFAVDDPEAVEQDLEAVYDDMAYAYVAYPERDLEEALFESVQLNEGPLRWLKGIGQKIGNTVGHLSNKDSGKLIDKFFNEGYILWFEPAKKGAKLKLPEEHKEEYQLVDQAITAAKHLSKEYPEFKIWVFAKAIDVADLSNREKKVADVKGDKGAIIACFRNGTVLIQKDKEIAEELNKIAIDHKDLAKTTGKTQGGGSSDPRGAEEPEDIDEVEEDLDALKAAAKETLGELKAADAYTPESYKKYEVAYKKILAAIEAATSKEALDKVNVEANKAKAEGMLVEKVEDEEELNLDDDDDELDLEAESLDEIKERLKTELGEMVAADPYTEESYKKYTSKYNQVVAFIEKFKTVEAAKKFDVEKYKTQLAGFLVKKLEPVPEAPGDIPEEPEDTGDDTDTEDTGDGTEEEEPENTEDTDEDSEETPAEGTTGKLSEVSEEQLKKLFTAVTGQGVGDNKKWQKVLKRMRAKLQELGESLDPSDYKPEDFIEEDLQSEADAIKSLKDTEATLKSAVDGIKNMTSAMREEYHKYANPAELKVMEDLEAIIDAAKNDALSSMQNWGIDISESDAQGWMSGNNEYSYQFMLDYEGIDEDEEEDIQDQLQNLVENAILSQYTLPPELSDISVSVALPDRDIAYEDEDGEELQDVKRASLFVDVTFARNLF